MRKLLLALSAISTFAMIGAQAPSPEAPAYTAKGELVAPAHYREWIYLTSGVDMSYTSSTITSHSVFDNVFVNPSSYRSFLATGTWPDKTTLVLEFRDAESPISINKRGHTQSTAVTSIDIHVKDNGTWTFYDLPTGAMTATKISRPADCYTCHESHAAVDTTFVQFYPTLLPLAKSKNTLSPAFLKEMSPSTK
jgi:Cytochrome P460